MANATVKQLNTLAAALPGVIAKLDGELAAAQKRMAQLKRAGLDYWDKLELVRTETLTCYNGIKGNGCGHCAACNLRANGLNHYLADKPRVMAAMKQKTGLK